ncbi:MAG TPA: UpxY family transcription antiterminator [Bacteroidales bacterium]|nr:UpxY family transcription antiterminator [Bacteroidales bacterium]
MADWFALYTRSRNEKKVHAELTARGIESFLPLQKTLKQWSDRKKWVEEPLIRSYVFVRITEKEYFDVLNTPGAVRFVFFEGKAARIPDWQINALRYIIDTGMEVEITDQGLETGDKVLITRGPFRDMPAELIEIRGKRKVVLKIDHTGHSILLTISPGSLKRL